MRSLNNSHEAPTVQSKRNGVMGCYGYAVLNESTKRMQAQNDALEGKTRMAFKDSKESSKTDTIKAPVATLFAVVPGRDENAPARFIEIGSLWQSRNTESSALSGSIVSEPNEWSDPHFKRQVVVTFRSER